MRGKKLLQTELFHPSSSTESVLLRGLTMANSMLLSLALGVFLNDLFKLRMNIILMVSLTIAFSSLTRLFDQNKNNLLCYFIMIGVMITGVIISKVFHFRYGASIEKVYNWCLTYDREKINYQKWSGFAVMVGILLLSCIITYVLQRFKRVKSALAVILPLLLVVSSINKIFIPKITMGVVIFYSLTLLVEFTGKVLFKSSNTVDNSIASIYLAPACVIIAMAAIILPSNSKPIQWNGVKNIVHKVQEQSTILMMELECFFDKTGNEFSVKIAGYSDDNNELGGEISESNNTSLLVTMHNKSKGKGYLIGSISNNYTGRIWEKSKLVNDYQEEDYDLDFYELLTAVTREQETGIDLTNIVKKINMDIEYYDIRTKTLFYPLKTNNINFKKETKFSETGQGTFLYEKAKGIGTQYGVQYYDLNLDSEILQNIFRGGGKPNYFVSEKAFREVAKDIFQYNTAGVAINLDRIKKELTERASKIKADYTTLPDTLPIRVRQLAYELTKDYNNDYDKLRAIETYLNTLTYTTKVGRTPKAEDFVDYFLFEQKQGYCTYFATAMGVLARCIGIPTRYVEGYVINYKLKDDIFTYKVLSNNAHSWIDAYIEGIGWIPFEPTPAFYKGRYTPWKENKTSSKGNVSYVIPGQIPIDYQNLVESVKGDYLEDTNSGAWVYYVVSSISILLFMLVLFAGIVTVYYRVLVRKYNKNFKNASNNKKLSIKFAEVLRFLDKEGYMLSMEETILSYAERIGDQISFNRINFLDITNIFMKVRYGEKEVKEEELQLAIQFCNKLEEQIKEKIGKRKMFFDRFLFLHFN